MIDLKNEFAWSWSRHDRLYECPRKIYWQHYGMWDGWKPDGPVDAKLAYRLKNIKTIAMLAGESLHDVISERLRMRANMPGPVPAAQMQSEVERRLLKRLRESRNRDWERFADPKHYAILFEDYYGAGISDAVRDAKLEEIRACVAGFAASPYGRRSFEIPLQRLRIIDPPIDQSTIRIDGIMVYAKPDLVAEDRQGMLHIVDWKMGKPRKANLAQLSAYGLYVSEKLGAPLERVSAHLVYLGAGEVRIHENLREGVAEVRRMIDTYTRDVHDRLTDVATNTAGDIERFPMTENRTLCRQCNFRELCGRMEQAPETPPYVEDD